MHEDLERLDRIDRLDRGRAKRQAEVVKAQDNWERARAELAQKETARAACATAVEDNRAAQKALQRKIGEFVKRRTSAERLLASGQGDPEAAERQVDRCTALIDDVETEMLELLEAQDALQAALDAAEAEREGAAQHLAGLDDTVPEQVRTLEAEAARLATEQDALMAELPSDLASRYQAWRARKKWAVARVVRNACDACRMEVQPQHRSDLRRGRIAPCRGCHRWLIPEPVANPA